MIFFMEITYSNVPIKRIIKFKIAGRAILQNRPTIIICITLQNRIVRFVRFRGFGAASRYRVRWKQERSSG